MRIATRDLRVVTAGLVSAVLLVGCSGNSSKPTVLPPLTTSATPAAATAPAPVPTTTPAPATSAATTTTAPTSAPSTPSAALTGSASLSPVSVAEASTFVKTYFQTAADALHDKAALARWKTYSLGCSLCDEDYNKVSKALAAGDRYEGAAYHLVSQKIQSVKSAGAVVRVSYYVTAGKVFDSNGKLLVSVVRAPTKRATIFTQHSSGRWYILEIQEDT